MGISQEFEGLKTTHAWLLDTISPNAARDNEEPVDFRLAADSSWLATELTQQQIGSARVLGLQATVGAKPVRAELHLGLTTARPAKGDHLVILDGRDSVAWRRVDELVTCVEDPGHDHDALALWSTLFAIYDRFAGGEPLRGGPEDLDIGVEQVDYYVTCEKGTIPTGMGERVRLATTLASARAGRYAPEIRLFLWNPTTDSVVGPLGTTGDASSDVGAWSTYLSGAGASPLPAPLADWLRDSHVNDRIGWSVGFTGVASLRGPNWSLQVAAGGLSWDGRSVARSEAHSLAKAADDSATEELQSLSSKPRRVPIGAWRHDLRDLLRILPGNYLEWPVKYTHDVATRLRTFDRGGRILEVSEPMPAGGWVLDVRCLTVAPDGSVPPTLCEYLEVPAESLRDPGANGPSLEAHRRVLRVANARAFLHDRPLWSGEPPTATEARVLLPRIPRTRSPGAFGTLSRLAALAGVYAASYPLKRLLDHAEADSSASYSVPERFGVMLSEFERRNETFSVGSSVPMPADRLLLPVIDASSFAVKMDVLVGTTAAIVEAIIPAANPSIPQFEVADVSYAPFGSGWSLRRGDALHLDPPQRGESGWSAVILDDRGGIVRLVAEDTYPLMNGPREVRNQRGRRFRLQPPSVVKAGPLFPAVEVSFPGVSVSGTPPRGRSAGTSVRPAVPRVPQEAYPSRASLRREVPDKVLAVTPGVFLDAMAYLLCVPVRLLDRLLAPTSSATTGAETGGTGAQPGGGGGATGGTSGGAPDGQSGTSTGEPQAPGGARDGGAGTPSGGGLPGTVEESIRKVWDRILDPPRESDGGSSEGEPSEDDSWGWDGPWEDEEETEEGPGRPRHRAGPDSGAPELPALDDVPPADPVPESSDHSILGRCVYFHGFVREWGIWLRASPIFRNATEHLRGSVESDKAPQVGGTRSFSYPTQPHPLHMLAVGMLQTFFHEWEHARQEIAFTDFEAGGWDAAYSEWRKWVPPKSRREDRIHESLANAAGMDRLLWFLDLHQRPPPARKRVVSRHWVDRRVNGGGIRLPLPGLPENDLEREERLVSIYNAAVLNEEKRRTAGYPEYERFDPYRRAVPKWGFVRPGGTPLTYSPPRLPSEVAGPASPECAYWAGVEDLIAAVAGAPHPKGAGYAAAFEGAAEKYASDFEVRIPVRLGKISNKEARSLLQALAVLAQARGQARKAPRSN